MADKQLEAINDTLSRLAESISAIYVDFSKGDECYEHIYVSRGPQRILFSTGTLAAGVWSQSDDIHAVCMSSDREQTFWDIVSEGLSVEAAFKSIPDSSTIEINIPGHEGKAYLRHCFTPGGFNDANLIKDYGVPLYSGTERLPDHVRTNIECSMSTYLSPQEREEMLLDHARRLQVESVGQNLAMIHDAEFLTCERDRSLKARGIFHDFQSVYSCIRDWANVSGLIGEHLGFLNCEALLWMVYGAMQQLPAQIAHENLFVEYFFEYWASQYSKTHGIQVKTPSGRELICQTPPRNVAIIGDVICDMQKSLSSGKICSDQIHSTGPQDGFGKFVGGYNTFLKIRAECWTTNRHNRRKFWDENLPCSLKKLQQSIPNALSPRLWPHSVGGPSTSESRTYILGFMNIIRVRLDSLNKMPYDQAEALITIEECSNEELQAFISQSKPTLSTTEPAALDMHTIHDKIENQKFRTASSVLSRLRWDPAHTAKSYDVGYLDRFEGLKWLALDDWGKATEDEDFIPEHRIRQFKRRDGVIVWDRAKRLDLTDAV